MARSAAVELIGEFLRSPDLQHRKNAASALAVTATPESLAALTRLAVHDPARAVRRRAEDEIRALPPAASATAADCLRTALNDPQQEKATVGTLGRLRAKGWHGLSPAGSMRRRIRLAARSRFDRASELDVASRFRALVPVLFGTFVAVFALACLVSISVRPPEPFEVVALLFFDGFTGAIIALTVSQSRHPVRLQFDRLAAMAVEAVVAAGAGVMAGVVVFLIAAVATSGPGSQPTAWDLLIVVISTVTLASGVRLGTLWAVGAFRGRRRNRYGQIVAGACFGVLIVTLELAPNETPVKSYAWALLVCTAFALATAFAALEGDAGTHWSTIGRLSRPFVLVAVSAVFVPLVLLLGQAFGSGAMGRLFTPANEARGVPPGTGLERTSIPAESTRGPFDRSFPVNSDHMQVDFVLATRRTVEAEIPEEVKLGRYRLGADHSVYLRRIEPLGALLNRNDDPPTIKSTLDAGTYRIEVRRYLLMGLTLRPADILPSLITRLESSLRHGLRQPVDYEVPTLHLKISEPS
jgi:hypothetical protein